LEKVKQKQLENSKKETKPLNVRRIKNTNLLSKFHNVKFVFFF
jgi:hypothetical protein